MGRAVALRRLAALVAWAVPVTVGAQIVEVPTFLVGQPTASPFLQSSDVAVAADGSLVFVWGEWDTKNRLVSVRFAADGTYLGAGGRVDVSGHVAGGRIVPHAQGGFLVGYQTEDFPYSARGRLLDPAGVPVGVELSASCEEDARQDFLSLAVAPVGTGAVFVSRYNGGPTGLRACFLDATGGPRGASILLDPNGTRPVADGRVGGGAVVAWQRFGGDNAAQTYDAQGTPVSGSLPVLAGASVTDVALAPTGGFAVVGYRTEANDDADLWAQRFAADGTPAAPPFLVYDVPVGVGASAALAFDLGGNLYVVWAEVGPDAALRVRGYDATGAPFGPPIPVTASGDVSRVATARLPSGSFVNTWARQHRAYANVVSLCVPGVAVCGDGVLVPQCEVCDDGGANSDSAPDACRTDCRPARCGDGAQDAGEGCDDGNGVRCDGCSPACQLEVGLVCGDGVLATTGCGETCDDANAVVGDGCADGCTLERIPGGGSRMSDCFAEWSVSNPANDPFRDARGAINAHQQCVDGDTRCDVGGVPGACTFRVRVCANNTDVEGCPAPNRLAAWALLTPNAKQASRDPALAAVRSAFAGVAAAVVGPSARDVCSDFVDVTVPLRTGSAGVRAGKLKLKTEAVDYGGTRDRDQLRLTCLPGTPP